MKKRKKRKQQPPPNNKEVVYPVVTRQQLEEFNRQLYGAPCILCGEPATHISVFVLPDDKAKLLGIPDGKTRQCVYPICKDCLHREDRPQRVEDIILGNEMASLPRV